jgi:hypothetical protein
VCAGGGAGLCWLGSRLLARPGVFSWAEVFRRARSGCGPGLISRLGLLERLGLNLNSNGPFEFKFNTISNNQIESK